MQQLNSAVSVQDNILFGRVAHGRARGSAQVGALVREVANGLGLREQLLRHGMDFPVGIAGSRLSAAKRQKLALARAILKKPDILVLDEPTASFDERTQQQLLRNIREEFSGRSLFWVLHETSLAAKFDLVVVMDDGTVAQVGPYESLSQDGGALAEPVE